MFTWSYAQELEGNVADEQNLCHCFLQYKWNEKKTYCRKSMQLKTCRIRKRDFLLFMRITEYQFTCRIRLSILLPKKSMHCCDWLYKLHNQLWGPESLFGVNFSKKKNDIRTKRLLILCRNRGNPNIYKIIIDNLVYTNSANIYN